MKKKYLIDMIMKVNPDFANDVQEMALWLLDKKDLENGLRVEIDILARNGSPSITPEDAYNANADAEITRSLQRETLRISWYRTTH